MSSISDLALRILISAKDDSAPELKNVRERIKSISDQLQQVEKVATRFLSFQVFSAWAKDAARLNDTYNEIQGKLSQVVGTGERLAGVQDRLFKSSQAAGASYKDTVDLYARSAEALKKLNDGQELAAKLTETVNLAFRAQRTNVAEASSTVTQLTQALGTGTVTWEDFGNVAQSNLLLVNTAAKNLGYDGVNSLKQAISESKVTGEQMARAIVAGFDDIKARADQMPLGISQSMTLIDNALVKFSGESNQVNIAASTVAKTLQFVADNMNTLANAGLLAAEVYGLRMVTGFASYTSAALKASVAVKDKTLAEHLAQSATQRSIVLEAQLAAVRLKAAQAMVNEARLQLVLADGIKQKNQASNAMAQAIDKLHAAESQYQTASLATRTALDASGKSATIASRAVGFLGGAIKALPLIGWAIMLADWATKLDFVYVSAMRVQEGIAQVALGIYNLAQGNSFEEIIAKSKALHAEYNKIIAENTNSAKQAAADSQFAEEQKSKAIEEAAQRQQAAFDKVKESTKNLTAQIDADAKAQTAAIQQALAEKLIAIEASDQLDAAKNNQRLQAQLLASQQEVALQQAVATTKLQLIDAEYQAELTKAAANAQRVKEIETEKRQAKLSVYQGVAEFYSGEIERLTQVYVQETQAFAQAKQNIENLAISHQQRLLDLDRMGMDARQKQQSEELEFNQTVRQLKDEIAKGEQADQDKINQLLGRAKTLQNDITQAAVNGAETQSEKSSAIYIAKQRENELNKIILGQEEANAKAREGNAKKTLAALESNKANLAETKGLIDGITEQLAKDYALKIGIDQASLADARSIIAELTKPATKIINIQTVNAAGGEPAQATGGLAGQPTGEPWRFNAGGWARLFGKLAGYGGGDKIRALLEPGEFIVRKEAVQKLGVPFLQAVNQGVVPVQRAQGGLIDAINSGWQGEQQKNAWEEIRAYLTEKLRYLSMFENNTAFSDPWSNRVFMNDIMDTATKSARRKGLGDIGPGIAKIVEMARRNGYDSIGSVVQSGINYLAGAGGGLPVGGLTSGKGFSMPAINLPNIPAPAPMQAPAKNYTVEFKAPSGGQAVTARFGSEADVAKMLDILKNSGMSVGA